MTTALRQPIDQPPSSPIRPSRRDGHGAGVVFVELAFALTLLLVNAKKEDVAKATHEGAADI